MCCLGDTAAAVAATARPALQLSVVTTELLLFSGLGCLFRLLWWCGAGAVESGGLALLR